MSDTNIVMNRISGWATRLLSGVLFLVAPVVALGVQLPVLHCSFYSLGEEKALDFPLAADLYRAPLVPINRHFAFKAVMVGDEASIRYVKLYTYFPNRGKFILLHQASYANPLISEGRDPFALTGEQRLYSPSYERELTFGCALRANES